MHRTHAALAISLACSAAFGQWTAIRLHTQGDYSSAVLAGAPGIFGGYRSTSVSGPQVPGYWTSGASSWVGLGTGSNFDLGQVNAVWGDMQGGYLNERAAIWHGTAQSITYLQDVSSSYIGTSVSGMAEGEQVGNGYYLNSNNPRALLWHGSAASMIDLTPAGASFAEVWTTDGVHQAGGFVMPGSPARIGLWSGSSQSFLDLRPPNVDGAEILGIAGTQLVGSIDPTGPTQMHAALWPAIAPSVIDLHPFPGFGYSTLEATNGTAQVGASSVPGFSLPHAGIWFGTPGSFVDLHAFLRPGYVSSGASSITESNGVFTIGGAASPDGVRSEAFVWVGVPAPGSALELALAWMMLRRRRAT